MTGRAGCSPDHATGHERQRSPCPARSEAARWGFTVIGGPDAPTEARHTAAARLDGAVAAETVDSALLLVTELVTNCVRHGGAHDGRPIEVSASVERSLLRVDVACAGQPFDHTPVRPVPGRRGGLGLYLVERLATRWGITDGPPPSVWFELRESGSAA